MWLRKSVLDGRSSGPVWLRNPQCTGNEVSLAECGHYGFGDNQCNRYHREMLVVLVCDNGKC